MSNPNYYDPATLEVLKMQLYASPEMWHKIMNPFCGKCMIERGKQAITDFQSNQSSDPALEQ